MVGGGGTVGFRRWLLSLWVERIKGQAFFDRGCFAILTGTRWVMGLVKLSCFSESCLMGCAFRLVALPMLVLAVFYLNHFADSKCRYT